MPRANDIPADRSASPAAESARIRELQEQLAWQQGILDSRPRLALHLLAPPYSRRRRALQAIARLLPARRARPATAVDEGTVEPISPDARHALEVASGAVDFVRRKIAPLALVPDVQQPRRIDILTSEIDVRYVFAGYVAVFHLARSLVARGHAVRLVLTDQVRPDSVRWRKEIARYQGLGRLFDDVEVLCNAARDPIAVHPDDRFVSTSWWTSHIAHAATVALGGDWFVYLTQEFEPLFYPHGHLHALARQSYALPHRAIYSTELLRAYARAHRLGVYEAGIDEGDARSASIHNAVCVAPSTRASMRRAGRRRLLLYARPEEYAQRNCFPLAMLALRETIARGAFRPAAWELAGIGTLQARGRIDLGHGASLTLAPRVPLDRYLAMLHDYDVGLALMLSPHPSLVPLDMAAAGLATVTNTFDVKTADRLQVLSSNLIAAEPTVDAIADALCEAERRSGDVEARLAGADISIGSLSPRAPASRWPRRWDDVFDDATMRTIETWLSVPQAGRSSRVSGRGG